MYSTFKKPTLYKLFFKILRCVYVISAILCLAPSFSDFDLLGSVLSASALLILGLQFYASILAERWIEEKNYWGPLLGMFLCLLILPGFTLPVAIFGFYSLLNKEFRIEQLPEELPLWFRDALAKLDSLTVVSK